MRFETRRRAARPGLALLSLMWLLVGIAGGMMLDRQVLAGTWFFSTQPSYSLMRQAWHLIGKYYVDRSAIDPRHATYAAISGMVATRSTRHAAPVGAGRDANPGSRPTRISGATTMVSERNCTACALAR